MPKLFLREEPCRNLIELLFFASVGDVPRMRELCQRHNIDVRMMACMLGMALAPRIMTMNCWLKCPASCATQVSDETCCDYDRRTPL